MVLPALIEAHDPGWRPIKYSLFPPLGLAALAAYLGPTDEVMLEDEHVMPLNLDDEPDLVVMSVYINLGLPRHRRSLSRQGLSRGAGRAARLGRA